MRFDKRLAAVFGFVILAGSVVFAEEKQAVKLTLDDAVEYALKNSRTLKSSDIDLEMKKRASSTSWNVFLPNVQASGTMSRANDYSPSTVDIVTAVVSNGKVAVPSDYDKEEDRWSTIGALSVSWNFNPAYIAQIQKAKLDYEGGKISWEQSQNTTVLNIKKLFYGLLLQQENLKIQKDTLENARQRYVQAQANFKNGLVPEISLLQTQVNYENTKPTVNTAEQTLRQNIDTLAFLIGLPVGTDIELAGEIEPSYVDVDTDTLLEKYGANDLNIKSLQNNIDVINKSMAALNLSTWVPSFALSYGLQPVYTGSDGAWHFYKGIGKDDEWYDSGSLSLTLAWNVTNMLPWSATQQQIKDLRQTLSKLEISMETLKENQKVEVRKAVDTLNQAREQIDAMGRTVEVAKRAYDMQSRSYRNGTTEFLDLKDTESSYNQAKLGLLSQKMSYITALLDLENTLNTELSEK
ncbi:MAG: TolC family protein [Treponema sp.]|nr:TolC family protein [Treponema sp.]